MENPGQLWGTREPGPGCLAGWGWCVESFPESTFHSTRGRGTKCQGKDGVIRMLWKAPLLVGGQNWVQIRRRSPKQDSLGQRGAGSPAKGWVWVPLQSPVLPAAAGASGLPQMLAPRLGEGGVFTFGCSHSLQGEDEGAVCAVAHLFLLLLTTTPQHHLPVWG